MWFNFKVKKAIEEINEKRRGSKNKERVRKGTDLGSHVAQCKYWVTNLLRFQAKKAWYCLWGCRGFGWKGKVGEGGGITWDNFIYQIVIQPLFKGLPYRLREISSVVNYFILKGNADENFLKEGSVNYLLNVSLKWCWIIVIKYLQKVSYTGLHSFKRWSASTTGRRPSWIIEPMNSSRKLNLDR